MFLKWFRVVGRGMEVVGVTSIDTPDDPSDLSAGILRKHVYQMIQQELPPSVWSHNLAMFANHVAFDLQKPLGLTASIETMGLTEEDPIIVYVPSVFLREFPTMNELPNIAELVAECHDLLEWHPGSVHSIPHMYELMKNLGYCTRHEQLYWREEEKQVASMLLHSWFGDLAPGEVHKRRILMGSAGVGKSTMLDLMTVYLALVKKKNISVFRWATRVRCLYFVGHQDNQVVYFTKNYCSKDDALSVYKTLQSHSDFDSVCLMLDRFVYDEIPTGLSTYHLLTTADPVNLSPSALTTTEICLHSSWQRRDLLRFGHDILGWSDVIAAEYYVHCGSLFQYSIENTEELKRHVSNCAHYDINYDDWVRCVFVRRDRVRDSRAYRSPSAWHNVINSETAITRVQERLTDKDLGVMLQWAQEGGPMYASLASVLLNMLIQRRN